MRRLEQRTYYPGVDMYDEWEPYNGPPSTWGWTDRDFAQFVRKWNRRASLEGDNTRLRSVDVEDE